MEIRDLADERDSAAGTLSPRNARWLSALALVAIAVSMAAMAAAAQAAPHWYGNGKLIPGSLRLSVAKETTKGPRPGFGGVRCVGLLGGTITNPASGEAGLDELSYSYRIRKNGNANHCGTRCGGSWIISRLPRSRLALEASAPGIRDVMEGVEIEVEQEYNCPEEPPKGGEGGEVRIAGIYKGTLKPRVGEGVLEFEGEKLEGEEIGECVEFGREECVSYNEVRTPAVITVTGAQLLKGRGKYKKITAH
jgi:hypothetical protein